LSGVIINIKRGDVLLVDRDFLDPAQIGNICQKGVRIINPSI
jgi:hypothetical protein